MKTVLALVLVALCVSSVSAQCTGADATKVAECSQEAQTCIGGAGGDLGKTCSCLTNWFTTCLPASCVTQELVDSCKQLAAACTNVQCPSVGGGSSSSGTSSPASSPTAASPTPTPTCDQSKASACDSAGATCNSNAKDDAAKCACVDTWASCRAAAWCYDKASCDAAVTSSGATCDASTCNKTNGNSAGAVTVSFAVIVVSLLAALFF
eukprot:TRINITY_DN8300_c0_g1_i1.p1 TRINITY_DN8300_c0_g1~~TRINITY_DN8300_c0_g1_i1.p1  ORF type:complete len:209 (+),score=61.86 TRINITY_DN8300_c0_g1_i1:43-669(+)